MGVCYLLDLFCGNIYYRIRQWQIYKLWAIKHRSWISGGYTLFFLGNTLLHKKCIGSKKALVAVLKPIENNNWASSSFASIFPMELEVKYSLNDMELIVLLWAKRYQKHQAMIGVKVRNLYGNKAWMSLLYWNEGNEISLIIFSVG